MISLFLLSVFSLKILRSEPNLPKVILVSSLRPEHAYPMLHQRFFASPGIMSEDEPESDDSAAS